MILKERAARDQRLLQYEGDLRDSKLEKSEVRLDSAEYYSCFRLFQIFWMSVIWFWCIMMWHFQWCLMILEGSPGLTTSVNSQVNTSLCKGAWIMGGQEVSCHVVPMGCPSMDQHIPSIRNMSKTRTHTDTRTYHITIYYIYSTYELRKYEQRRKFKGNYMMSMNFREGNARDS